MRRLPGAHPDAAGTTFVAWTTTARAVDVRLFDAAGRVVRTEPLEGRGEGWFDAHLDVKEGALYKLVLDGDETPDPYASFLPSGIHGPARVVAPVRIEPLPEHPPPSQWVIYELHVGTFSPEGRSWPGDERTAEPHARVLALYRDRAMLALRKGDPVLSAKASWDDVEATAHGDVLEVVRRKGAASRRLVVTFGDGEHVIGGVDGARVLFASMRFEGGRLAARGAVVLAID